MHRIQFDDIANNSQVRLLLIVMILFFVLHFIGLIFMEEQPDWSRWAGIFGYLLMTVFLARMFLFKNYVQWNKKGIIIKVDSFVGKSIAFQEVRRFDLRDDQLEIIKTDGRSVLIDLKAIEPAHVKRLYGILRDHVPKVSEES